MSVLFYSALHLSFVKLLFHLHVLLFDHIQNRRPSADVLYRSRALESSIH